MPLYNTTLAELYLDIASALDDVVAQGTVTTNSSNSNTLVCTSLYRSNGHYIGGILHIYSGTDDDITREINDSWQANTTVQFYLNQNSDTTDSFCITRRHTYDQYKRAINRAIEMGCDEYLLDKIDATTQLTTDTYEYSIPSGFRYISQIYLEDATDANTYYTAGLIDNRSWWILPGSTPKIKFDDRTFPIGSDYNTRYIRIVGQQVQGELTQDTNTCLLPPEFVIQQAKSILLADEGKIQEAQYSRTLADIERRRMIVTPHMGAKSVYEL